MTRIVVSCSFSEMEIKMLDELVDMRLFCSRSDAIRQLTRKSLERIKR